MENNFDLEDINKLVQNEKRERLDNNNKFKCLDYSIKIVKFKFYSIAQLLLKQK